MMNWYSIIVDGGTFYVNGFNGELCVGSMKFEKGKRVY